MEQLLIKCCKKLTNITRKINKRYQVVSCTITISIFPFTKSLSLSTNSQTEKESALTRTMTHHTHTHPLDNTFKLEFTQIPAPIKQPFPQKKKKERKKGRNKLDPTIRRSPRPIETTQLPIRPPIPSPSSLDSSF